MNILVMSSFKPNYGGNFIAQLNAVRNADKNNKYVFVFPSLARSRNWCQELTRFSNVYYMDVNNKNMFSKRKELKEICNKENINLIHTNFSAYDIIAGIIAQKLNIKLIIHTRSSMGKISLLSKYKKLIKYRYFCKNADIITINPVLNEEYLNFGIESNKLHLIYDGVTFDRLKGEVDKVSVAQKYGIDLQCTNILIMGYDIYIKGVDIALDGIDKARVRNNQLNLLIVVASHLGELKKYLHDRYGEEIPSYIKILPPNQNILEYYTMADAVLSSSRREGLSNVLVEAMYCNKRIIVSDIPGTKWSWDYNGVTIYPVNDASKLSDLMLLPNGEFDNKEKIVAMFSMDNFVEKIKSLYDAIQK